MNQKEMQYIEDMFDMSEEEPGAVLYSAYLPTTWGREFREELDRRLRAEGLNPCRIGYRRELGEVIEYIYNMEPYMTPAQYKDMVGRISA